jgi:hypothetical protein
MNAMFGGFNDPFFAPPAANIIEAFLLFDPLLEEPNDLLLPASQYFNFVSKIGEIPFNGVITILQPMDLPNIAGVVQVPPPFVLLRTIPF